MRRTVQEPGDRSGRAARAAIGQRTVALLGTARDDFVIAAAGALEAAGAAVTIFVRRGREAAFAGDRRVVTFDGRIGWFSLPLLAALRKARANTIAIVIGDQFAHTNVTTALNWWRAAGLLRGADIYCSSSTQPIVLEGFNSIDQRQWLGAVMAAVLAVPIFVRYPATALVVVAVAGSLELAVRAVRRWRTVEDAVYDGPVWPILVDDPQRGWRLRPAEIAASMTTTDGAVRAIRITVDAAGERTTGTSNGDRIGSPVIAFYGGSEAFGNSLSDEETIPWQAASLLTGSRIVNRAVPGYDVVQAVARVRDDVTADPPAAVILMLDGNEPNFAFRKSSAFRFPNPGHGRFSLSDRIAAWSFIRRALNRAGGRRNRERVLRAVEEQCARKGIPFIVAVSEGGSTDLDARRWRSGVQSITIPASAPSQTIAALLVESIRTALDDRRRR